MLLSVDEDDVYPSEQELDAIREWRREDFRGLLGFVRDRWWPDRDYGWQEDGRRYAIATGGWSGNEELVAALKQNTMFWMLCWQMSRRGGYYEFEVPG